MPAKSRILFAEEGVAKISSIDKTLKKYGKLSATELVSLTHRSKSPWSKTWKTIFGYSVIEPKTIKEFHKYETI